MSDENVISTSSNYYVMMSAASSPPPPTSAAASHPPPPACSWHPLRIDSFPRLSPPLLLLLHAAAACCRISSSFRDCAPLGSPAAHPQHQEREAEMNSHGEAVISLLTTMRGSMAAQLRLCCFRACSNTREYRDRQLFFTLSPPRPRLISVIKVSPR